MPWLCRSSSWISGSGSLRPNARRHVDERQLRHRQAERAARARRRSARRRAPWSPAPRRGTSRRTVRRRRYPPRPAASRPRAAAARTASRRSAAAQPPSLRLRLVPVAVARRLRDHEELHVGVGVVASPDAPCPAAARCRCAARAGASSLHLHRQRAGEHVEELAGAGVPVTHLARAGRHPLLDHAQVLRPHEVPARAPVTPAVGVRGPGSRLGRGAVLGSHGRIVHSACGGASFGVAPCVGGPGPAWTDEPMAGNRRTRDRSCATDGRRPVPKRLIRSELRLCPFGAIEQSSAAGQP